MRLVLCPTRGRTTQSTTRSVCELRQRARDAQSVAQQHTNCAAWSSRPRQQMDMSALAGWLAGALIRPAHHRRRRQQLMTDLAAGQAESDIKPSQGEPASERERERHALSKQQRLTSGQSCWAVRLFARLTFNSKSPLSAARAWHAHAKQTRTLSARRS